MVAAPQNAPNVMQVSTLQIAGVAASLLKGAGINPERQLCAQARDRLHPRSESQSLSLLPVAFKSHHCGRGLSRLLHIIF